MPTINGIPFVDGIPLADNESAKKLAQTRVIGETARYLSTNNKKENPMSLHPKMQEILGTVVPELEQGRLPWKPPWAGQGGCRSR
jgi:hypothetical protein